MVTKIKVKEKAVKPGIIHLFIIVCLITIFRKDRSLLELAIFYRLSCALTPHG